MSKAAKIERRQKAFLKAMKEKFTQDPAATSKPGLLENVQDRVPIEPVLYKVIDCPICHGRGYHGPKRTFCHSCGSTGKKRVRT
jgi:hypothetical protein